MSPKAKFSKCRAPLYLCLALGSASLFGCGNTGQASAPPAAPEGVAGSKPRSEAPTGDRPAPAKADALQATKSDLLISDFEAGTLEHALGGVWESSFDSHGLGTTQSPSPFALSPDGYAGSKFCLRISGHFGKSQEPWPYADMRASFPRKDLTPYQGVRFWAKGDGKDYIVAIVRDAVSDFSHFRTPFTATTEWKQIQVEFANFKQPDWGKPMPLAWNDVTAISFQPGKAFDDEDYDLAIDQVELVRAQ